MSFRKRNLPLSATTASRNTLPEQPNQPEASDLKPEKTEVGSALLPGTRVSPLTGQPTTSTGTPSLDNLLGGHSGLPVGSSILIGENGTTDNAGALLRCYAAEGLAQDHVLHVVSVGREWIKGLPGLVGGTETEGLAGQDQNGVGSGEPERGSSQERSKAQERMKIAWRYERFAAQQESRGASLTSLRFLVLRLHVPTSPGFRKMISILDHWSLGCKKPSLSPRDLTSHAHFRSVCRSTRSPATDAKRLAHVIIGCLTLRAFQSYFRSYEAPRARGKSRNFLSRNRCSRVFKLELSIQTDFTIVSCIR